MVIGKTINHFAEVSKKAINSFIDGFRGYVYVVVNGYRVQFADASKTLGGDT